MRFVVIAFSIFFLALTQIQAAIKDQVSSFHLDNGMQVVVIEDHRAPVVVHMLWYRAGSADETPGQSGVAHFLEHLLFKGTKTLAPGEFSQVVAKNGGSDNAFTSYDYTAYYQRIAADRLELMMQMESDRMMNIQLTEEEVLTERDVIIEERNQRTENNPNSLFWEQFNAVQYVNHRYGTPVIGWRHEMENLTHADALAYYRQFYAPNNTILIVAGDVTPEGVRELAQKYYAPLKANPNLRERDRPAEPPKIVDRRLTYVDERVGQPYLAVSYLAPERDEGEQRKAAALTLLAELLGGGQTAFLNRKLMFETQKAVYVAAYYSGVSLDDTSFGFVIAPAPNVTQTDAEEALHKAVAEFFETGVDEAQLARIKMQLKASLIYAQDATEGLANSYGRALASGLTLEDIHEWPDILQSITPEEILEAGREVFRKGNSVTGWVTANAEDKS